MFTNSKVGLSAGIYFTISALQNHLSVFGVESNPLLSSFLTLLVLLCSRNDPGGQQIKAKYENLNWILVFWKNRMLNTKVLCEVITAIYCPWYVMELHQGFNDSGLLKTYVFAR